MARFSIGEDDEDAPLANKRPRFSEPASPSQPPRSQRSVRSQPSIVTEEDEEEEELIPIEDVESDSQGLEEEEDDEDNEFELEADVEDEEEDVGSEDYGVHVTVVPVSEVQNRPQPMISPVGSSHIGLTNRTPVARTSRTSVPVFNNANGSLQAVLTDPDVLDCPICLDPLSSPVFQCENGHIACDSCCHKVHQKCPSCCMPIGYNRCRAIEKVLESLKISCKNAQYGCKETIPYSKKTDHEQTCLHSACFCPYQLCPFAGCSSKILYLHFGIQHSSSTTRFTYNTTFILRVELNQKHIFLQEQHESVIFVLNQEAKQHARSFHVDCVGPDMLKTCFSYQLTAKNLETSLSIQSVPEVYAKWYEHFPRKNYLTVPSEFAGYNGILSLHVCIKKAVVTV